MNQPASVIFVSYANRLLDELSGADRAGSEAAIEQLTEDATDPDLQRLGQVMTIARQQALIQNQLNQDRDQLHSGRLSHAEDLSVGHHYEMLRREACEYNHLLRGFIEANRDHVGRDDLTDWLSSASGGHRQWATGEITGALSEIALHAALMGMPEIRQLRYGTVDEDLHGYDFVAEWQGRELTVDAKTGDYRPLAERKHGHRHLEISVPREELRGLMLSRHGLRLLRHEVRRVLHAQTGTQLHATHAHYR